MRPAQVNSSWSEDTVEVFNDGDFRVIFGRYSGNTAYNLGVRWSYNYETDGKAGFPQSFGHPSWLVIPCYLTEPILLRLLAITERSAEPRREFQANLLKAIRRSTQQVHPAGIQKVFALYAASNSGKTMTLNRLIDLLAQEGNKEPLGGMVAEERQGYDGKAGDRCAAIRVFGKLVVVVTFGDSNEAIKSGIAFARRHNADILVSATRKRSDSGSWSAFWKEIVVNASLPYEAIEKKRSTNTDDAATIAEATARTLFERIRLA